MTYAVEGVVRTYKNAAGVEIAQQTMTVSFEKVFSQDASGRNLVLDNSLSIKRFNRTAKTSIKTLRYFTSGISDYVVASVETNGTYASYEVDAGDILSVTFTGTNTNDVIIPVTAHPEVLKIGDTV
jgi:hypothetical protein